MCGPSDITIITLSNRLRFVATLKLLIEREHPHNDPAFETQQKIGVQDLHFMPSKNYQMLLSGL